MSDHLLHFIAKHGAAQCRFELRSSRDGEIVEEWPGVSEGEEQTIADEVNGSARADAAGLRIDQRYELLAFDTKTGARKGRAAVLVSIERTPSDLAADESNIVFAKQVLRDAIEHRNKSDEHVQDILLQQGMQVKQLGEVVTKGLSQIVSSLELMEQLRSDARTHDLNVAKANAEFKQRQQVLDQISPLVPVAVNRLLQKGAGATGANGSPPLAEEMIATVLGSLTEEQIAGMMAPLRDEQKAAFWEIYRAYAEARAAKESKAANGAAEPAAAEGEPS